MTEEPDIATLRRAMSAETRDRHLDPDAAATAWSDARATRAHRTRTALAVAAGVIVVIAGATVIAKTLGNDTTTTTTAATTSTGPSACTDIATSTLPTWARSGFNPPDSPTPHVLGANGTIVGILFGNLRAHQPVGNANKILWVAKDGQGALNIKAQLEDSDKAATRTVDLGPSIVNLPAAGCWRMTLTWPGHRDTVALRYQ